MNDLAQLEALLFVAGEEGLSLRYLAGMLQLTPSQLKELLQTLAQEYEREHTAGLCLIETVGRYKMATKETFSDLLREFAKAPVNQSLSRASLEVLIDRRLGKFT